MTMDKMRVWRCIHDFATIHDPTILKKTLSLGQRWINYFGEDEGVAMDSSLAQSSPTALSFLCNYCQCSL